MTQADGMLPEAAELRAVLGRARIVFETYETAIAKSAAVMATPAARTSHHYDALTLLTEAHADMCADLQAAGESLGLPYERVIEATCVVE